MDEDQHKSPDAGPSRAAGVGPVDMSAMTAAERAVDELLSDAHFAAAHHLPDLVARHAATMGVTDAVMYLADLQQQLLVPFLSSHAAFGERPTALGMPWPTDTSGHWWTRPASGNCATRSWPR